MNRYIPTLPSSPEGLQYNKALSDEFGLHIYDSKNPSFPFFVEEWDECFTREEIEAVHKDHAMIECLSIGG